MAGVLPVVAVAQVLAAGSWGFVGVAVLFGVALPNHVRRARSAPPVVDVDDDGLTLRFDGVLRAPLRIDRDEIRAVVPIWLLPEGRRWWQLTNRPSLTTRTALPVVGDPPPPRRDVLAVVLRHERGLPEARWGWTAWMGGQPRRDRPVRGLLLAVDDHEEAQRPFLRWPGALQRLDDEAFEWLEGR